MGITLTRQTVAGLTKPGIYFDDQIRGFGCRVRLHADGKVRKTFIMQYRIDGRQRRQKIPTNNIDVARKKAEQMHAQIVLGTDPALKKETERASTVLKFSRAVEQYLDLKKTDLRPTSLRLATLYLTRPQYFGQMHAMPLTKITRSHVSSALDKIVGTGAVVSASRAKAHLSAFYVWALQRGHCDLNPCVGSANPETGPGRDRVLSDDELVAVWKACKDDDFGKILRLIILTGCRRAERFEMERDRPRGGNSHDTGRAYQEPPHP